MTLEAVKQTAEMPLHSNAMKPPFGVLVLLHRLLWRVIIMREGVETAHERKMYVASTLITPWHWLRRWSDLKLFWSVNKTLRNGGSAGATLRDETVLNDVQNRLDVIAVPAGCLPRRLRTKPELKDANWRFEMYEIGGFIRGRRQFLQYGVTAEFCPESIPLPEDRASLGSRWVWWLAGRPYEFAARLQARDEKDAPPRVLAVARAVGTAKARALLPLLFALAVFGREKKKA